MPQSTLDFQWTLPFLTWLFGYDQFYSIWLIKWHTFIITPNSCGFSAASLVFVTFFLYFVCFIVAGGDSFVAPSFVPVGLIGLIRTYSLCGKNLSGDPIMFVSLSIQLDHLMYTLCASVVMCCTFSGLLHCDDWALYCTSVDTGYVCALFFTFSVLLHCAEQATLLCALFFGVIISTVLFVHCFSVSL